MCAPGSTMRQTLTHPDARHAVFQAVEQFGLPAVLSAAFRAVLQRRRLRAPPTVEAALSAHLRRDVGLEALPAEPVRPGLLF